MTTGVQCHRVQRTECNLQVREIDYYDSAGSVSPPLPRLLPQRPRKKEEKVSSHSGHDLQLLNSTWKDCPLVVNTALDTPRNDPSQLNSSQLSFILVSVWVTKTLTAPCSHDDDDVPSRFCTVQLAFLYSNSRRQTLARVGLFSL